MVEVKKNEAEYQLLQAKSNFETGRMALNSLIGVNLQDTIEIDRSIPKVSYTNDIWISDGTGRPEIRMAHDQLKMVESSLKLTDSGTNRSYTSGWTEVTRLLVMISVRIWILTMWYMPNCPYLCSNGGNAGTRSGLRQ